jgi:flagellar M-ring protein FliF
MPVQSRIISVMLVAAIAIGLAFLVRGEGSAGREHLFGGRSFGEQELDAVELAFSRAGLNDFDRVGRRITIPTESKAEYLAALEESATLPISLRSSVQDAINAASVFESSEMLKTRQMHAKEQDLGHKIEAFPEIRWASVEYDQGERRGLGRSRPQSASVVVQPEGTGALSRQKIVAIKELIRGSYAGMSSDDVVVIDTNSTSGSALDEDYDPLLRKKSEAEARIEQKVRSMLVGYPARVAVSAEIDPTMDVEMTTLKYDAEPTNLTSKTRKTESSSNRRPKGGVPGTGPNAIGNRSVSLDADRDTTTSKDDERETSGVTGQQYENSRLASLQVKTVRVSVGLPMSYYEAVNLQEKLKENPNMPVADIKLEEADFEKLKTKTEKNIQSAITPLLPDVSAGEDRFPLVQVWDYPDLPSPAPPEPETAKLALTWLAGSWQTIALVLLALVALLVARSAAKGSGDSSPTEFHEGFGLEIPAPPPEVIDPNDDQEQMTITGGSLKEELLTLVEGNPEVAANVIRGWVGEAA